MILKVALVTLFIVLLYEQCECGRDTATNRHPPKEKEGSLVKPKQDTKRNRFYRSVMPSRPTEEGQGEEVPTEETPSKDMETKSPERQTRLAQLFLELEEMKELAEVELRRILQKTISREMDLMEQLIKKKYQFMHETLENEPTSDQIIGDDYKVESGLDNNLAPFEAQKVALGDPNTVLQRKRWRRAATPLATHLLLSGGLSRLDSAIREEETPNHLNK